MTVTRANAIIAAGIALVNGTIPFCVLMDWIHMNAEQVAGAMGVVSLAGTFVGLLFASTPVTNTPEPQGP